MSVDKLCAQTMKWEDFLERLTVDEETSADQWDELVELHAHPFNLNTATREQLEQLPFLSPVQISHILTYLHTYGPLTDFSEAATDFAPSLTKSVSQCEICKSHCEI